MKVILYLSTLILLQSCTLSLIMTDTHGDAEDVVDSSPSSQADVKPVIEIPLTPTI
jgi:hypothetical protein